MSIKLAVLKSGEQVIADAKELVSEEKVHGYLFTRPHKVVSTQPLLLTEEQKDDPEVNRIINKRASMVTVDEVYRV